MRQDFPAGPAATSQGLFQAAARQTAVNALLTFLITFSLAFAFSSYLYQEHTEHRRLQARIHAQSYAQRIQDRLQSALTAAYVLASVVRQAEGRVDNFDEAAAEILANFPAVSAVQLAPGGVIRHIHPLAGNEGALGHDLLKDRNRNREAHLAIATRQLTLAGPFDLVQGGVGTVARMPVFLHAGKDMKFWGFAIILIRIPNLLDTAGISELVKNGYRFELWRHKPDSEERYIFARRGDGPPADPVEYSITVPNGRWMLGLAPEAGWDDPWEYMELVGFALAVAAAITGLQIFGLQSFLRVVARARLSGQ